jgi:hypothetical protein
MYPCIIPLYRYLRTANDRPSVVGTLRVFIGALYPAVPQNEERAGGEIGMTEAFGRKREAGQSGEPGQYKT